MSGTVLVTGATGGLGRVLAARLLADGRDVVASGRNPAIGAELSAQGLRFHPVDLVHGDLDALCHRVGTVHHLAALSSPWGPDRAFEESNVLATRRLLDAARRQGVRRFIHASTPSIYTRPQHQLNLTEASPLPQRMVNAYARTKLAAERMVLAANAPGFATVALRPRAIISQHDTVLLPRLLRAAERGRLPLPGDGRALIEPSDARDIAAAFVQAEARAEALGGQVFNLSGGQPVPLRDLAAHVFARLGRSVAMPGLPARLALAMAGAAELAARLRPGRDEPVLTRYSAMALGWSQTFDLGAAREQLGWSPAHSPFEAIDHALQEMGLA